MYFLMDGSDLDDLYLWIYSKRTFCCDKEVTIENLLQPSEPKNCIPVPEDNVLRCLEETDENVSDDIHIDIVENEHISQICYIHICREWQKDHCNLLRLPYIHGNMEHHTTHVMVSVNHCPSSPTRIFADGNWFFRALSFSLTGSQDYHQDTAPQHLVCRAVQSLHTNHMQMSIVEVFVCRRLHINTSMIPICIRLKCRLCTALHTKCCGAERSLLTGYNLHD